MKNIYRFLALTLTMTIFYSCEEDLVIYDVDNGQSVTTLASSEATLPVPAEGATYDLVVEVTTRSDVDRTISYSVDPESTADASEYTISDLIVPAGEFVGNISITGNFDAIPDLTTTELILNLDGLDGAVLGDEDRLSFTLSMFKQCPSDLVGTYIVSSTGVSTDGGTGFPTVTDFPYTVEVAQVDGTELEYTISDGVAGVYIEWYTVYGYTFETEGNFIDVCDSLSGSWVDAFGSTITLTGSSNGDGTLTITWVNGFADTATAIYTKQ